MDKSIKFKKNLIIKRIIFLLMLLVTFFLIFNFSSQDAEVSGSVSRKVTAFIVEMLSKVKNMDTNLKIYYIMKLNPIINLLSKFKNMDMSLRLHYIEMLHPIIRKLAHFSIYTLVGFSIMGFMCTFNIKNIFKLIISMCVGVTYAVTDEIHQSFIPGRMPQLFDVGIDSIGVLTGILIMIFLIILFESLINWLKR